MPQSNLSRTMCVVTGDFDQIALRRMMGASQNSLTTKRTVRTWPLVLWPSRAVLILRCSWVHILRDRRFVVS